MITFHFPENKLTKRLIEKKKKEKMIMMMIKKKTKKKKELNKTMCSGARVAIIMHCYLKLNHVHLNPSI
jgi:hypothetical protein